MRTQVTSRKDQAQYWHDSSRPYAFISAEELAGHFRNFAVGRQIAADLAKPPPQTPLGSTRHGEPEVRGQFSLCMWNIGLVGRGFFYLVSASGFFPHG